MKCLMGVCDHWCAVIVPNFTCGDYSYDDLILTASYRLQNWIIGEILLRHWLDWIMGFEFWTQYILVVIYFNTERMKHVTMVHLLDILLDEHKPQLYLYRCLEKSSTITTHLHPNIVKFCYPMNVTVLTWCNIVGWWLVWDTQHLHLI